MRPIILSHATKVLIAVFALAFSFTDFAQARDRFDGERQITRRHHGDREFLSGTKVDSRLHRRDRNRKILLSGRKAESRYFERRYGHGRYGFDRRPDRRVVVRQYRGQRHFWTGASGGDGFPSDTAAGTYFGSLSAWTDPGNGTYFRSDRTSYGFYGGDTGEEYRAPRAKIIRVNPSTAGRACSWESGVCVIRR